MSLTVRGNSWPPDDIGSHSEAQSILILFPTNSIPLKLHPHPSAYINNPPTTKKCVKTNQAKKLKPSTMSEENTTKQKITSPSPFSSSFRFIRFSDQPNDTPIPANHFELDECDVFWPAEVYSDVSSKGGESLRRPGFPEGRFGLSAALAEDGGAPVGRRRAAGVSRMFQQSAPVNVPVWPRGMRKQVGEEGEEEEAAEDEMLPPHLMVARSRSRAMAFSVFEGVGRTLKGRDLRRVRNAVFQKTGFLE